jgi:branched-chain amino acid transport system permease protein
VAPGSRKALAGLATLASLIVLNQIFEHGFGDFQINPYTGFIPGMKAFTAAVLGGIGNIPGAMVGGMILGLLEAFAASYLSLLTDGAFGAEYKDVVAFLVLILILIFRPKGLLGETVRESKA